ncbi:hypothetical protein RDV89_14295 [Nocardioides zeae]|uniref:FHA domain-containing protein n=1 Tax=Nocardioides imazamoxiresistens TaxID=3231893 RepID=A0ABU3PYE1_9ACTN|nr:FHA domain-containing protein [Nocardioides zeae]MDT9594250.1 hypothetical protein [Nocardioides zeae]
MTEHELDSTAVVARSYRPGSWFAVFGTGASVLLPPSEKRRVAALWALVDDGAAFDEVLDALIATGLRDLPAFVLLSEGDGGEVRIVVRGAASAVFTTADGETEVSGASAGTWVEQTLRDVTRCSVALPDAQTDGQADGRTDGGETDLPIGTGLVRVARVDAPAVAAPVETPVVVAEVGDEPEAEAEVLAPATPAEAPLPPAPAEEPAPVVEPVPAVAPVPAAGFAAAAGLPELPPRPGEKREEPEAGPEPEPEAESASPADEAPADEAYLEGALPPEPVADERVDLPPPPVAFEKAPEPEPQPEPAFEDRPESQPAVADNESTVFAPVLPGAGVPQGGPAAPAAPAAPEESDEVEDDVTLVTGRPAPSEPVEHPDGYGPLASTEPYGSSSSDSGDPSYGSSSAMPPLPPRAPSAPAWPFDTDTSSTAESAGAGSPDDGTMAMPAVEDEQSAPPPPSGGFAPPGWAPTPPAPEQPAPADDEDHDGMTQDSEWNPGSLRPPQGIPGQPPAPSVTVRPVAKLVFSHGETLDVDRAVLIGRAPEARRFTSAEQPRLVTVPSPQQEISSTHLEIRPGSGVDHGTAVATDMGSTNGTVLVQPGLPPEELKPGIAVQLIPGAVIDLGDGLTIQVANP